MLDFRVWLTDSSKMNRKSKTEQTPHPENLQNVIQWKSARCDTVSPSWMGPRGDGAGSSWPSSPSLASQSRDPGPRTPCYILIKVSVTWFLTKPTALYSYIYLIVFFSVYYVCHNFFFNISEKTSIPKTSFGIINP